jgi:hypothetical protein
MSNIATHGSSPSGGPYRTVCILFLPNFLFIHQPEHRRLPSQQASSSHTSGLSAAEIARLNQSQSTHTPSADERAQSIKNWMAGRTSQRASGYSNGNDMRELERIHACSYGAQANCAYTGSEGMVGDFSHVGAWTVETRYVFFGEGRAMGLIH